MIQTLVSQYSFCIVTIVELVGTGICVGTGVGVGLGVGTTHAPFTHVPPFVAQSKELHAA
jgi:hypothetical protein